MTETIDALKKQVWAGIYSARAESRRQGVIFKGHTFPIDMAGLTVAKKKGLELCAATAFAMAAGQRETGGTLRWPDARNKQVTMSVSDAHDLLALIHKRETQEAQQLESILFRLTDAESVEDLAAIGWTTA